MSKLRALVLALLVSFSSLFAACDDDEKTEEEPQAGETVECVVTEDEDCMEEPAGEEMQAGEEPAPEMDMELPVEAGETPDEMDMELPVEAGEEVDPMPEAGDEEPAEGGTQETTEEAPVEEPAEGGTQETTEEAPVEETPAGEEGEPVDPAPQAGEPG